MTRKGGNLIRTQASLLVSDSLPQVGFKPGPALRKTPEFTTLASALKNKEFLSDWMFDDESTELQLRESLNRTLADDCYFAHVRTDRKVPIAFPKGKKQSEILTKSGSDNFIKPNGAKWLGTSTPPRSGNWAAIPKIGSRIYVLDFDVRKFKFDADGEEVPTTLKERWEEANGNVALMSSILGVDLTRTYAQLSPSGGIHIFLKLPEDVDPKDLPATKFNDGMRKLAGIPEEDWGISLQGDIRSGAANGIILMAGSNIQANNRSNVYVPAVSTHRGSEVFKDFKMARKLNLLVLPMHSIEALKNSLAITESIKIAEAQKRRLAKSRNASEAASLESASDTQSELVAPKPVVLSADGSREISYLLELHGVKSVLDGLEDVPKATFHASRAHIFKALSCCYTDQELIQICRVAGYGKDSYRERTLSNAELQEDFDSLRRRGFNAEKCGSHCPSKVNKKFQARADVEPQKFESIEEFSAHSITKLRSSSKRDFVARDPKSFNPSAITYAVLGEGLVGDILSGQPRKIAAYRLDALDIAMNYFNPLFNSGAKEALASSKKLMEIFNLTDSQLRSAMRHLRDLGIIKLTRRQVQGSAPGYSVGKSRFIDPRIGYYLRKTWSTSAVMDSNGRRSHIGGYFDYIKGQVRRMDGEFHKNPYLLDMSAGFAALLDQLGVSLSSLGRTGGKMLNSYMSKPVARYMEAKSYADSIKADEASNISSSTVVSSNVLWKSVPNDEDAVQKVGILHIDTNNYLNRPHSAGDFGNSRTKPLVPKSMGPPGRLIPRKAKMQSVTHKTTRRRTVNAPRKSQSRDSNRLRTRRW